MGSNRAVHVTEEVKKVKESAQDTLGGDIKGGCLPTGSIEPVDNLLPVVVLAVCSNAVLV